MAKLGHHPRLVIEKMWPYTVYYHYHTYIFYINPQMDKAAIPILRCACWMGTQLHWQSKMTLLLLCE